MHTCTLHTHINTLLCVCILHSPYSHTHDSSLIAYPKELQRCHDDLKQARSDLDKQKGELDEKSKALQALKRASGEKEAELLSEISRWKEQSEKDRAELEKVLEKAKEVKCHLQSIEIKSFFTKQKKKHLKQN